MPPAVKLSTDAMAVVRQIREEPGIKKRELAAALGLGERRVTQCIRYANEHPDMPSVLDLPRGGYVREENATDEQRDWSRRRKMACGNGVLASFEAEIEKATIRYPDQVGPRIEIRAEADRKLLQARAQVTKQLEARYTEESSKPASRSLDLSDNARPTTRQKDYYRDLCHKTGQPYEPAKTRAEMSEQISALKVRWEALKAFGTRRQEAA